MNLIAFFGLKIKPKLTRGKGMWNPLENQVMENRIFCIRDKDANCFIIKTDNGYIAIDSGYKNSSNVRCALSHFGINRDDIRAVFLTHLDIDHAGGMDSRSDVIYPKADVYLGEEEKKYLDRKYFRKRVLFHKCRLPISLSGRLTTLNDSDTVNIDGVKIQAIHAPGHTLGHMAYIVDDKWLFTGDCIIANEEGGWSFYDFWNQESSLNMQTMKKLKELCETQGIEHIITSHSGLLTHENAFLHTDTSPDWRKKGFVFCKNADFDPYI